MPELTMGLAGTDVSQIEEEGQLADAVLVSPSLGERKRPGNAQLAQDVWDRVVGPKNIWSTPNAAETQS